MTEVEIPTSTESIPSQPDITAKVSERRKAAQAKSAPQETPPPAETTTTETVVETPKEEKKTETPAAKVETPAEEPKKKYEKHWKTSTEKKEETPAEAAENKSKETPVAESGLTKAEKDELASLRSIVNKASVKKILQAEESGKDFDTYYEELRSKDPYKQSYPDLYKAQLEDQGLSKAEIERKMERFAEMDEDDQLDRVASFRKQQKEKFDQELKEWTPKIEAPQEEANLWTELAPKYEAVAKKYENQKLDGITVTPEMAKNISEFYKNNSLFKLDEQGNIDPDDMFKKTHQILNIDLIKEECYQGGYNDGFEKSEEANGVGKPLSSKNGASTPQPRQEAAKSEQEKRINNLKASLPQA